MDLQLWSRSNLQSRSQYFCNEWRILNSRRGSTKRADLSQYWLLFIVPRNTPYHEGEGGACVRAEPGLLCCQFDSMDQLHSTKDNMALVMCWSGLSTPAHMVLATLQTMGLPTRTGSEKHSIIPKALTRKRCLFSAYSIVECIVGSFISLAVFVRQSNKRGDL